MRPFFLMMKLLPIKMLDDSASASPICSLRLSIMAARGARGQFERNEGGRGWVCVQRLARLWRVVRLSGTQRCNSGGKMTSRSAPLGTAPRLVHYMSVVHVFF